MKTIDEISRYIKLLRKYNALRLDYDMLKEQTKNKCFDKLLDKIGEPEEIKRLRKENKRLRIRVKDLKKATSKVKKCHSSKKTYISCKVSKK